MAIFLMLASFVGTVASFKINRHDRDCLRSAFLKAAVIHGVMIVLITELLSLNRAIAFNFLAFWWILLTSLNSSILLLLIHSNKTSFRLNQIKHQRFIHLKKQNVVSLITISGVILVLSVCLVTALVVPPHNYDSMTYHLPRVMHWIQNRSVAHYPTHNLRQISFPPGVGYIMTHLQILSGGDRFANCVQWLAFLGSILGTSLIAQTLGGIPTQSITALVCASIPMAIMQSTTPQTDLTVSFWLVCFAYFIFRSNRYSKLDIFWLSASLGLAILAKPTGIIFGMPLLIVLGFRSLGSFLKYRCCWRSIFQSLIFSGGILIISLSLSLPSYWRNYQTFGAFLGIDSGTENTTIGLGQLISNVLRNLALNMPIPKFWQLVENIHKYILKIDVNDSAITFQGTAFNYDALWWRILWPEDENYVGNPVHLILLLLATATLISVFCLRKNRDLSRLLFLTIGNEIGFLLFCFLVKWQEWGNRLIVPFFILNSPIIGYFISLYLVKSLQLILLTILIYMAIFYSIVPLQSFFVSLPVSRNLSNISHLNSILLLKPKDAYFRGAGRALQEPYTKLIDQALSDKCHAVGLDIGDDDWEYPIWPLMASQGLPVRIKHVNIQNQSQQLRPEFSDSELCAIFEIRGLKTRYVRVRS